MINYAVVGLSDPRHRHLLAPLTRRRAGIRPVAVADPGASAAPQSPSGEETLSRVSADARVPAFTDHQVLLAEAAPSLVGVALPSGAFPVVRDAVAAGADILALPPLADSPAELAELASLVDGGAGVTAVHTWRGHQTSTVAAELLERGSLGQLSGVALTLAADLGEADVTAATYEVIDLFLLLTGAETGTVRIPVDGAGDEAGDRADHGSAGERLRLEVAAASRTGVPVRLEVWQATESDASAGLVPGLPPQNAYLVQVIGSTGSVEWDVRSGRLASAIDGREPVLLSCGLPDREADWVLASLVRSSSRPLSGHDALVSTRILLAAKDSEQAGGESRPW